MLLKNCPNKFISCIFTPISNSCFSKSIINTNKFVSKTTRKVILIFFVQEPSSHSALVIDKTHLYTKNLSAPKYEYLIKKHKDAGIRHVNDPNAFIVYSNTMENVYKDIDNYNPKRNKQGLNCF